MKEKIYTVPVTEAFRNDCECPLCVLEKKLEDEYVDYTLGPSLMEPDSRIETNEKGFCQKHFELLYNKQVNRLGLGLIIDSFMNEKIQKIKEIYQAKLSGAAKESEQSFLKSLAGKLSSKQSEGDKPLDELTGVLASIESSCTICSKLKYTMGRYIEVTLYLWKKEDEFRNMFHNKGFCLRHFGMLLDGAKQHLSGKDCTSFVQYLLELQLTNLERIHQEVNWFTKKFDYRYNDAPWGNSKDAIQRGIQKIVGYSDLK